MAITRWIGTAVENKEHYFWKEDVCHQIGKRTPQEHFSKMLQDIMTGKPTVDSLGDDLWIQSNNGWLRINRNGEIEFGEAAA